MAFTLAGKMRRILRRIINMTSRLSHFCEITQKAFFGILLRKSYRKYRPTVHNKNAQPKALTRCHAVAGTTARCALYNECTNPNPVTNLIPVHNLQ